jgi:hypothetical protein
MPEETVIHGQNSIAAETSSLLSEESGPGDVDEEAANSKLSSSHDRLHRVDISGFSLLPKADFWLLFIMLGILTGIGLMTINNIGNDVSSCVRWSYSVWCLTRTRPTPFGKHTTPTFPKIPSSAFNSYTSPLFPAPRSSAGFYQALDPTSLSSAYMCLAFGA